MNWFGNKSFAGSGLLILSVACLSARGDDICPLSDMMHHDGFCDYYAVRCSTTGQSYFLLHGPHGAPTGGCGSPACFSTLDELKKESKANESKLKESKSDSKDAKPKSLRVTSVSDVQDAGYHRKSTNDLLEWDPYPNFVETDANQVRTVVLKYVKYKKEHSNDIVYAQIVEFEYSVDFGINWRPFKSAFEIQKRTGTGITPVDLGRATKVKEHSHSVFGYDVLTHYLTLDN